MKVKCKNCNHWEEEQVEQDNMGVCDVLGANDEAHMYVLPVINSEIKQAGNMLTSADFGCNQFAQA